MEIEVTEQLEKAARDMGWAPKEDWRGDPDKWIDADTFVKRGEEIIPILRATNKKQAQELAELKGKVSNQETILKANQEAIEALKESNSQIAKDRVKARQGELVQGIKAAREENDVDREVELQGELTENRAALKQADKPNQKAAAEQPWTAPPILKQWMDENPWFGEDKRKTALANGIAVELTGKGLVGRPFLDKLNEELDEYLGVNSKRNGADKVNGDKGSGAGGGGRERAKSFADLPPDAIAACESQGKRLIGPGRAFKTEADWRKHYVTKFFE